MHEVFILGQNDSAANASSPDQINVLAHSRSEIAHVRDLNFEQLADPLCQSRRQLRVHENVRPICQSSCDQARVIELARGIRQTCGHIFDFEIGQLANDLASRHARCKHLQNIDHADAQTSDARPTAALSWLDGDPREKRLFGGRFLGTRHIQSISRPCPASHAPHLDINATRAERGRPRQLAQP